MTKTATPIVDRSVYKVYNAEARPITAAAVMPNDAPWDAVSANLARSLESDRARLIEALRNLLEMTDHFPECNEFRGGYMPFSKKTARDLLRDLEAK